MKFIKLLFITLLLNCSSLVHAQIQKPYNVFGNLSESDAIVVPIVAEPLQIQPLLLLETILNLPDDTDNIPFNNQEWDPLQLNVIEQHDQDLENMVQEMNLPTDLHHAILGLLSSMENHINQLQNN